MSVLFGGQKKPGNEGRARTGRIYEGSTIELKVYSEGQIRAHKWSRESECPQHLAYGSRLSR